jgi:hypothetical protein
MTVGVIAPCSMSDAAPCGEQPPGFLYSNKRKLGGCGPESQQMRADRASMRVLVDAYSQRKQAEMRVFWYLKMRMGRECITGLVLRCPGLCRPGVEVGAAAGFAGMGTVA